MKKRFLLLLTVVLLIPSLAGCEHFVPDGGQVDRPPLTPADDPAGTPSDGPAGEEDPTVDEYGFTLFPEGNYLADPMFDTDEFLPDYDMDLSFLNHGSSRTSAVCATGETIFSFTSEIYYEKGVDYSNHLLRYTDKATGLTLPLCGKPECTHDSASCNAWVERHAYGLRTYGGKLMWVDEETGTMNLTCMNMDGTDREKLARFMLKGEQFGDEEFFIHRGYVYYSWESPNLVENGEPAFGLYLYAQPMNGGESFAILDLVQSGSVNSDPRVWVVPSGNDIFIMLSWKDFPEDEESGEYRENFQLYRWSSKTRKAQQLYSAVDGPWDFAPEGGYPVVISGDGIYFVMVTEKDDPDHPTYTVGSHEIRGWIKEYTLIRYSFDKGDFEKCSSFSLQEGTGAVMLTREHIVLYGPMYSEENTMRVYGYEWEPIFQSKSLLDVVQRPDDDTWYYWRYQILGDDGEYIYYLFNSPKGNHVLGKDISIFAVPLDGGDILDLSVDSRTMD